MPKCTVSIFRLSVLIGLLYASMLSAFAQKFPLEISTNSSTLPPRLTDKIGFFTPAETPNNARIIGISAYGAASYTATMIAMNKLWYSQYDRTSFHFFNDNAGWLQMDKIGHTWTAYSEAFYAKELYEWAGVDSRKAAWIGGGMSWFFQGSIELLDGYSSGWGASVGDLVANTAGSALMLGQELAWEEQRMRVKFSFSPPDYSNYDLPVQQRASYLYGDTYTNQILKDYNGQIFWLSVNPASFLSAESRFPKWLNVAVGYSGEDMFGAEVNQWTANDATATYQDYSEIERYRQYLLSLDIDLSRIKTRSHLVNMFLQAFNTLKIPAPALELNTNGKMKVHGLYF
ncbi:MAG: DUF2279 domain-containing protein [Chitinophagales bacterium]